MTVLVRWRALLQKDTCAHAGLIDGGEQRLEDWCNMLVPAYRTSPANISSIWLQWWAHRGMISAVTARWHQAAGGERMVGEFDARGDNQTVLSCVPVPLCVCVCVCVCLCLWRSELQ